MNFRAKVRHFSLKCKLDNAKIGFSLKIFSQSLRSFSKRFIFRCLWYFLAYLCVVDRVECRDDCCAIATHRRDGLQVLLNACAC